jgi:large subunit ribosomal protein L3
VKVPTGTFFVAKMLNKIFVNKSIMTGKYTPERERVGVTVLSVPKMVVKDLRTKDKNGYNAVRVELSLSHGKKAIKEIRTDELPESGTEIKFEEVLQVGDKVNVSGTSKGKGFAGVVKRHGFKGGPRTHGQSDRERAPGSSGSTTTPGRVFKGTKRSGHMGNKTITIKKLRVIDIDAEKRILTVNGSVPGFSRSNQLLSVKKI